MRPLATSRLLALLLTTLALLLGGAAQASAGDIGARWSGQIKIYDATGDARWGVPFAAEQWAGSGVDIVAVSAPCAPGCITVTSSATLPYAGLAQWSRTGSTITSCTVTLPTWAAGQAWAHHSTLHEIGHCLGLAHNARYRKGSVMNATVSTGTWVTRPSGWDLSNLRDLYRR